MRIAIGSNSSFALVYLAQALGYFDQEDLKVELRQFPLGKKALDEVVSDRADLATVYVTPFLYKIYAGEDLALITGLHRSDRFTGILACDTCGIDKASQLAGRRVALIPGTSSEYFLHVFARSFAIPPESLRVVGMNFEETPLALAQKKADAVVVWGSLAVKALENIKNKGKFFYTHSYVENSILAGKRSYIEKNPEVQRRILRALLKAEKYYSENLEASYRIVQEILGLDSQGLSFESWKSLDLKVRVDHVLLQCLRDESRWIEKQLKTSAKRPHLRRLIEEAPLRQERDLAVTIL